MLKQINVACRHQVSGSPQNTEKQHTETQYNCKFCDKDFKRKGHLDIHERIHSGERPFLCHQCGKGFRSRDGLKSHIVVHSDKKAYSCNKCKKSFKTSHQMRKHQRLTKLAMSKKEPNYHRPVKCNLCRYSITSKLEQRQHKRFHQKGGCPFVCSLCKKSFSNLKELGKHHKSSCRGGKKKAGQDQKTRAPSEAQFACHRCSKRFKTVSNLGLHFITHTGTDHFRCSTCKSDFETASSYQEHKCMQQQQSSAKTQIRPKLIVKFQTCVLDPRMADSDSAEGNIHVQESISHTTLETPVEGTGCQQELINEHAADMQDDQSSEKQDACLKASVENSVGPV